MIGAFRKAAQRAAEARVIAFLRATREPATVQPAQGLFNWRCHENVAEWCRTHPGHACVECVTVDGGSAVLHYIARDPEGTLLEVSLGYRAAEIEYFVIRTLSDPAEASRGFNDALERWRLLFLSRWGRLLGVERVV